MVTSKGTENKKGMCQNIIHILFIHKLPSNILWLLFVLQYFVDTIEAIVFDPSQFEGKQYVNNYYYH